LILQIFGVRWVTQGTRPGSQHRRTGEWGSRDDGGKHFGGERCGAGVVSLFLSPLFFSPLELGEKNWLYFSHRLREGRREVKEFCEQCFIVFEQ